MSTRRTSNPAILSSTRLRSIFGSLVLLFAAGAFAADDPTLSRTHRFEVEHRGRAVGLSLELGRVAIQCEGEPGLRGERAMPAGVREALVAEGIFDPDGATAATDRGLWFVPLRGAGTSAEIDDALERLARRPQVRFTAPVLRRGSTTVVPTDHILLTLERDTARTAFEALVAEADLTWVEEFRGAYPIHRFRVTGRVADIPGRLRALAALPGVRAAELDSLQFRTARAFPNDPFVGQQWFLRNSGQAGNAGADAYVSDAWSAETGTPTITVAVIDTGVDVNHPDLIGQLVPGHDATTASPPGGVPGNADGDAHGTACAGIIGATGNNGIGVAGVCWDVSIMPVRIFSTNGNGEAFTQDSWIIDALTWAADNGADVLSNSWGGGLPSTAIESAIQHGLDTGRGGLGCVTLFASGNDNVGVDFPAAYANTLAIGAASPCDERKNPSSCDGETWWGSNFGPELDIVAPGVLMMTTDISGAGGYTGDDYVGNFNGTSSATPLAAGAAALLLSADPTLTWSEVRTFLRNGADDQVGPPAQDGPGFDDDMGFGRLNVRNSLALVLAQSGPSVTGCTESAPGEVTITWTNGGSYDSIEIEQEGVLIQTLAGTATSVIVPGLVDPLARFDVIGVIAGVRSVSDRCDLVLVGNTTDLVWSPAAGTVDGGTEIANALVANGRNVLVTGSLSVVPDLDAFERIWVNLGVFPSNVVLGAADAALLEDYLTNGIGGSFLYLEGADTWFFDTQHPLHSLFGVSATGDGNAGGDLTTVTGTGAGVCDLTGLDLVYTGENNYIDRLTATGAAFVIQSNSSPAYDCAVFHDAGNYRSIAASFELGGFFDGASSRADLVGAYLACTGAGFVPAVTTLICGEVAGDVTLGWSNPGGLDAIEVDRDGVTIATLAGTSTGYTDPAVSVGAHGYAVRGVAGGVPSADATCAVTIAPAAVTGLSCSVAGEDVNLSWIPPAGADEIAIVRDGVEIALLAATATATTDLTVPGGTHTYEVIARASGVDAPSAGCSVDVLPDALASFTCTSIAGFIQLNWAVGEPVDELVITRDGLPYVTVGGAVTSHLDDTVNAGLHDYTITPRIGTLDGPTANCTATLAPQAVTSLSCSGGELSASLSWTLGDGYDAIDVLRDGGLVQTLAGSATSFTDPVLVVGSHDYQVVGRTGGADASAASCTATVLPAALTGLVCVGGDAIADLSWTNGMVYANVEIRRDGVLIANLNGSDTSYSDPAAPLGTVAYSVLGRVGGLASAEDTCTTTVTLPPIAVLDCLLVGDTVAMTWTPAATYDAIEVRRDGVLLATLPGTDTSFLDVAAPGGNHTYTVTPSVGAIAALATDCSVAVPPPSPTNLAATITDPCLRTVSFDWTPTAGADSIEVRRDGVLLETLPGTASTTTMSLPADGTFDLCVRAIIDGLVGADGCTSITSSAVDASAVSGLSCGVDDTTCLVTVSWGAHATAASLTVSLDGVLQETLLGTATGATVSLGASLSGTIEVAGTNSCGAPLTAATCVATCAPPVQFVRGDANADGALDISDPIRTLQVLFEGLPSTCDLAMDVNDDDALDISDVIATLGGIFGGGALPGAPFPLCGEDPTAGSLTCVTFSACP